MMELDHVLNGEPQEPQGEDKQAVTPPEPEKPADEPKGDTPPAEPAKGEGEPPAPESEKHVPLSALEAERKTRQDWKEKAVRAEERQKALEAQLEQIRQQQPQQPQQPPSAEALVLNERFNMSEMMLRQQHEDVDEVIGRFMQEAEKNPALGAELRRQTHPYQWAYQYAKRLALMDEIGNDPNAYREKLKEQIKAELAQQQPAEPAPPKQSPQIPQSLASARSVGSRTASAYSGPTPLDAILKPTR